MNDLSKIFADIKDGATVTLESGKVYDVRPEDSYNLTGYFCSNTAKLHENPLGTKFAAIYLKDKKNIVIDGRGAAVIVHGKMTPMIFDNCENVTVRNIAFDYACPTMTEFTVLSEDGESVVIRINSDCLFRVENNELIWHGEEKSDGGFYWENKSSERGRYVKVLNPKTRHTKDFRREDLEFERIECIDENTLRLFPKNKGVRFGTGNVFQTRNIVRDQTGSMFQRCRNLCFEDLRIMFMHGLGMVSQFCENVTYRNCDLTPKEGRTIASTADFFQFSGCRGKLKIENCKAWGAQDDYVNVHGTHLRIVEKDDSGKTVVVRFMHSESWGFQAFEVGDELEFIRWDTLIPYGKTSVLSYEKLNDTDIKLSLTEGVPESAVIGKDVVENVTWTPDLHVVGCDFGHTSGRGILCTTRGEVIIENNRFESLWGPALLIEDDCNFWFESGYTKEILFRNNIVTGCEFGKTWETAPVIRYSPKVMNEESQEYVHGRLVVSGNTFEKAVYGTHSFRLEYLAEAEITDNRFDAPFAVNTKCVGKVTYTANIVG
ncbi:MAG: hypothetical protein IKB88_02350 [Clostridia bacterium]|nr:hypothetical protein [Clostridia bacterium]